MQDQWSDVICEWDDASRGVVSRMIRCEPPSPVQSWTARGAPPPPPGPPPAPPPPGPPPTTPAPPWHAPPTPAPPPTSPWPAPVQLPTRYTPAPAPTPAAPADVEVGDEVGEPKAMPNAAHIYVDTDELVAESVSANLSGAYVDADQTAPTTVDADQTAPTTPPDDGFFAPPHRMASGLPMPKVPKAKFASQSLKAKAVQPRAAPPMRPPIAPSSSARPSEVALPKAPRSQQHWFATDKGSSSADEWSSSSPESAKSSSAKSSSAKHKATASKSTGGSSASVHSKATSDRSDVPLPAVSSPAESSVAKAEVEAVFRPTLTAKSSSVVKTEVQRGVFRPARLQTSVMRADVGSGLTSVKAEDLGEDQPSVLGKRKAPEEGELTDVKVEPVSHSPAVSLSQPSVPQRRTKSSRTEVSEVPVAEDDPYIVEGFPFGSQDEEI